MIDVIVDNILLMLELSIPETGIALAKYMLAACHCASLLGSLMLALNDGSELKSTLLSI